MPPATEEEDFDDVMQQLFKEVADEVERVPHPSSHRFASRRSIARARRLKVKRIQRGMVEKFRAIITAQHEEDIRER